MMSKLVNLIQALLSMLFKILFYIIKNCPIIIKSTVPVGFTDQIKIKFNYEKILFSPGI